MLFAKWKQKSIVITLFTVLIFASLFPYGGVAHAEDAINPQAEAAILIDGSTGKILYQKNIDAPLAPASMTKMMTEYLVLEAVKKGKISWDQKTRISEYAHNISQNRALSNVPLRIDDQYSVKELYQAMAIYSANGAAIALGELVGGSEANFVKMMNDKAKELGMTNYKFVNCTGLNNKDLQGHQIPGSAPDEENIMSARSTAILAFRLLKDYPEVLETSSIPKKVFREGTDDAINMENWNWMLPGLIFSYEGVDGLKTGSTDKAGDNFTGTAKRNDMRLISVVMKTSSREARFAETRKLFDYGFNTFTKKKLYDANHVVKGHETIKVAKGKDKEVPIATSKPLEVVVKRGEEKMYKPYFSYQKHAVNKNGEVQAPIKKGKAVGSMGVKYTGGQSYDFLLKDYAANEQVDVVATQPVEEAGWFRLAMRGVGNFFSNLWSGTVDTVKGWF